MRKKNFEAEVLGKRKREISLVVPANYTAVEKYIKFVESFSCLFRRLLEGEIYREKRLIEAFRYFFVRFISIVRTRALTLNCKAQDTH